VSIESESDLLGIQAAADAVALTLYKMRNYARPGMSTKELDDYGQSLLESFGARSAPSVAYGFPGATCISLNAEAAHGIPSAKSILQNGDLVNIDVSAELNGFWADNGGSFVLGEDVFRHGKLVDASKNILRKAIANIRGGVKIAEIGRLIETEAKKSGFNVIRNLVGHGIGRSLHEEPHDIACYYDRHNQQRFRKNSVVAIETFISTRAGYTIEKGDGWTMVTPDGSLVAQHEHTILVTGDRPIILTDKNGIWD
jgi:methionyl aminopeptidase